MTRLDARDANHNRLSRFDAFVLACSRARRPFVCCSPVPLSLTYHPEIGTVFSFLHRPLFNPFDDALNTQPDEKTPREDDEGY